MWKYVQLIIFKENVEKPGDLFIKSGLGDQDEDFTSLWSLGIHGADVLPDL